MIERNKEPNLGMWNGRGGHIEVGESPLKSCIREIEEEAGSPVPSLRFGGVLTWEDWSFDRGGLYFFSAQVRDEWFQQSEEGRLAWQPIDWVMTSPQVVENIPEFLPDVLNRRVPRRFHCRFDGEQLLETNTEALPAWITDEWIQHGKYAL